MNLYGCAIGDDTRIGAFVEIQKNASIGARCKIASHTFVCEGVTIEDEVFVGHGVMFINDPDPRATADGKPQTEADWGLMPTRVCRGASIGSGAVILGGVTIGAGALVGAGAVVTKDVAPGTVVAGCPARFLRHARNRREADAMTVDHREPHRDPIRAPPRHDVPFLDLKAQFADVRDEVDRAARRRGRGRITSWAPGGARSRARFADYVGAKHCIGVNSGTSALHLALIAAGVGPGDEVITVPMTFIATSWAISYFGATPVFVDVDPVTYTMDPSKSSNGSPRGRRRSCRSTSTASPPTWGRCSRSAGGTASRSSRTPPRPTAAPTTGVRGRHHRLVRVLQLLPRQEPRRVRRGRGGRHQRRLADTLTAAALRDHAQPQRYHHDEIGFNYRMDAFQGAVLGVKLKHLAKWTRPAAGSPSGTSQLLAGLPLKLPVEAAGRARLAPVRGSPSRSATRIRQGTLEARASRPACTTRSQSTCSRPTPTSGTAPATSRWPSEIAAECLSLPLFPEMTDEQQDAVVEPSTTLLNETWRDEQFLRRVYGAGDRRGRADRLAHRRSADRRRRRARSGSSTTCPAAGSTTWRPPRRAGTSRSSRPTSATATPSRGPSPAATTSSTRPPSASRSAPSSRASASTCWSAAR